MKSALYYNLLNLHIMLQILNIKSIIDIIMSQIIMQFYVTLKI